MTTTPKTYQSVLDETVEYYATHRRAVDSEGRCVYLASNGDMCAVGRCMIAPENATNLIDLSYPSAAALLKRIGMDILKPEYRHLNNIEFWQALQRLHDDKCNWDEGKLTELGQETYYKIQANYCQ